MYWLVPPDFFSFRADPEFLGGGEGRQPNGPEVVRRGGGSFGDFSGQVHHLVGSIINLKQQGKFNVPLNFTFLLKS